jgi:hypothetical protein
MSAASSPDLTTTLIIFLILVFFLARRTVALLQGTRYSVGRLTAFASFYVLLFGLLAFSTVFTVIGLWGSIGYALIPAYAAVVVAATLVARPFVQRRVVFESRSDGEWYYRLPVVVPALYLVLFVVRFGVEIVVLGPSFLASPFLPPSLPTGLVAVLVGVDLLFGMSTGILIGRSVGVYQAFQSRPAGSAGTGSGPLPSR